MNNIYIKTLFIKIHKKFILKANSITIIPNEKVNKDITSIHKKIYHFSKIIPLIENLTLKNIKYKKSFITLIQYKKNKFTLINKNLKINGYIIPYKHFTQLRNINVQYLNYQINNLNGIIKYKNDIIKLTTTLKFNNNPLNIDLKLNKKDVLNYLITSKKFKLKYNKKFFILKNVSLKGKYNIDSSYIKGNLKSKSSIILDKKLKIKIDDLNSSFNNKNIKFIAKRIYLNKIKNINNLNIKFIKGSYYIPDDLLIVSKNSLVSLNYKKFKLKFNDNYLIYKNLNNFSFISKNILAFDDYNISVNNLKALKLNKFLLLEAKNNEIKNKFLQIYNDLVYFRNNLIEIPNIKGNYKNLPFSIQNSLINIKNKKAIILTTNFNDIIFTPTIITFNDNNITISTHSKNILINKNLKEILNVFNINYINNLSQLKGKNILDVNSTINIKNKNANWNINLISNNSVFKYNTILFSYKNLNSYIKNYSSNTFVKKFKLSYPNISFISDSNITTTPTYLNAFMNINQLNIYNIINIKNYFEKVVFDFKTKLLYFLNSQIYINTKNKTIFFLSLKNIIKYSIFKNLIDDGSIILHLNKKIFISGDLKLKKPIFLNQKDPKLLHANIKIQNNDINIISQNINANIKNYSKIIINMKNLDIYTNTLIDIYNQINKIIPKNKTNSNKTTLEIKSQNTTFTYNNHKFLSQKAYIKYDNNLMLKSKYKTSILRGYTKQGYFLLEGKHYEKEELIPLLDFFNHFRAINLDFVLVKSPDDFYTGKVYINSGIVKDLTLLNNIIAFLNTIPSILSLSSPGFSAKGYKIKKGFINYLYYKNILYLKQIKLKGINLDFYGKGFIDFNKNIINLKITAKMKMKIKKIPIVGKGLSYILFGKDGAIDVKIFIKGDLNNPKVTQDIGKNILLSPFELFKRAMTLPFHLF